MESGGSATGDYGRHHLDQQQPLQPPAGWSFASVGGVLRLVPSYTCVYCKREFPSAQALGGHTNAHRKERASLRPYHLRSRLPNLDISPPVTTPAVHSFFSTTAADEAATSMVAAAKAAALEVNLELEGGGGGGLDLELRLGCS